jgi:hypothetical protein
VALKQRHQLDSGMSYTSNKDLAKWLKPLSTALEPCSEDTIIMHSASNKRKLLIAAKESLQSTPIQKSDARVKMFLKADKAHAEEEDVVDYGAPRCIQYRNKRYCLRLATFLHPVETAVYKKLDNSNTPIFAKSRNLTQRGQDLRAKFEHFTNPTIICIDHSKFDAHVGVELLRLEHNFYKKCFQREHHDELHKLLSWQMINKGYTKNDTQYQTRGTRMSGDQNTGLGNSIINYAMLRDFVEFNGWRACYYIDGDDSVIIVEGDVKPDPKHFEQFGMKTKIEAVTKEFRKIEFCQTRPVFDGTQWRMVRNPFRMLARIQWAIEAPSVKQKRKYLRSVGLCEMSLGLGLPIGQYIGRTLSKLGIGYMVTSNHYRAMMENIRPGKVRLIEPTMLARMEFQDTWGISIADQLLIERSEVTLPTTESLYGYDEEPYPRHQ